MKIGCVSAGVLLGPSAGALGIVLFGLNYELQSVGIQAHAAGVEGPGRSGALGRLELRGWEALLISYSVIYSHVGY